MISIRVYVGVHLHSYSLTTTNLLRHSNTSELVLPNSILLSFGSFFIPFNYSFKVVKFFQFNSSILSKFQSCGFSPIWVSPIPCSFELGDHFTIQQGILLNMKIIRYSQNLNFTNLSLKPPFFILIRGFSLWSMKKDPDLESALSHNRRWIVNNQIKNIILRYPNQVAPVNFIQKKFKTLDLQGKALNWLNKYPCCFEVFRQNDELYCQLTKPMMCLVEEEEAVKEEQVPVFAERLAKILLMSSNQRLSVVKLDELKRNFGFPDDYLIRIVPKYSEMFRLINYSGRKSSMEVELISWNPKPVSYIEMSANKQSTEPRFSCSLPSTWVKSWERFHEFNSTPYISPYADLSSLVEGSKEHEKRTVALVHELLSLTLWKKLSIMKLSHFRREFALPEKLNVLLLKHPGIFYVTNKYRIYTVVLREGYDGSKLNDKDPLVLVKDKFGELMQGGLHEYNQRGRLLNLEKRKNKGMVMPKVEKQKDKNADVSDEDDQVGKNGRLFDPEERKRFYKILFEEDS